MTAHYKCACTEQLPVCSDEGRQSTTTPSLPLGAALQREKVRDVTAAVFGPWAQPAGRVAAVGRSLSQRTGSYTAVG